MRRGALATVLALAASVSQACGGGAEGVDATVASVTPVRGAVRLGDVEGAVVARAAPATVVRTSERGLARVALDDGPQLLLDRETALRVDDGGAVTLEGGRVFAEAQAGEPLVLSTAHGALRAADASFSVRVGDGAAEVYVVRGEVSWTQGEERGLASSGEELRLGDGVTRRAAVLFSDWTGGLARPGPASEVGPAGVGTLEARVPDEVGRARWPLVVRRLDVRVRIDRDLAITEVDQLFFNPASEAVEGLYRIRVPEGAVLSRFAVDRDDRLVDGYVREKAQARAAYEAQVYRGSTEDPALLEWDAPGAYRARIYPIAPGATRRIVIRYAEWLGAPAGGADRMYRYPMGGGARAPHIQEFALSADVAASGASRVRAGMGAIVEQGAVRIRRSDFRPRSDFWLELVGRETDAQRAWRAPHQPPARAPDARTVANEADERDYFYLPLVLPASLAAAPSAGMDVVVVADVSAATPRAHLELGRTVVESLVAHLDGDDRVAVVSADLTVRSVVDGEPAALGDASAERIERLLDGLARVPAAGATDLGEAVAAAARLLDPARQGAIVYVGDGAPTVGELRAEGLLERFARLPAPVRLYAVAVGSDANVELLDALTRGGGLTMRVEERAEAPDAAMRVLAHAARPIVHSVEVALGDGLDNVFPRRPMDAVVGEVFPVVGRVRGELPRAVRVTYQLGGEAREAEIPIDVQATTESTDLRLRWAGERLRQLLLQGAGREDVAELGTRYGLITPFTSYYVPSRRELAQMGPHALGLLDRPLLRVGGHRTAGEEVGAVLFTAALGPLSIAGCLSAGSEAEPAGASPEWLEEAPQEPLAQEGAMGEQGGEGRRTNNRFGIEGAPDDDRVMAREAARDEANNAGALGALGATTGAWNAPTTPFPSQAQAAPPPSAEPAERSARADATAALGGDMGDEVGGSFGFGGLGLRGTGRGGGGEGEGTIGLGELGTIGHGGGSGSGSGYGRGAGGGYGGGPRGRDGVVPRVRTGEADVRGGLSREVIRRVIQRHINEVRFCYEQELASRPDLAGRVTVNFVIGSTGAVLTSALVASTLGNERVEACILQAVRRWTFPQPPGGGVVAINYPFVLETDGSRAPAGAAPRLAQPAPGVTVVTTYVEAGERHRHRRCSDAASLPLADRQALWGERLAAEGSANGWARLYHEAIRDCEADGWRERRAFLTRALARAGGVEAMTQLYGALGDGAARAFVRERVLARVRTPEDLRAVRAAFGMGRAVDWTLVEQILERAPNDAAKVRAMRRLVMQYSWSSELKLRLMRMLERTSHTAEAKRLAQTMRADPAADATVRTAIGEMYLRLGDETEARRVFSEIVEFAPLDELARRRLGDLYRAHGWHEEAYRQYQTLREIRPDAQDVLLLLAQAAAGAGRVDEALRLEHTLMQTSEPGSSQGVARTALLWSSVRYARLRKTAREAGDRERLEQLDRRFRRSGVLREAGALRVTLVWSHPDAQLGLWVGLPGLPPTRPYDLSPEHGLEAFHLDEQEGAPYRFEVRRQRAADDLTRVAAQLVVVWNEGAQDEQIEIVELSFEPGRERFAWTLSGRTLTSVEE
ncbi:MAG: AgmX/PglI C-terminal domain-containing protein [Sandaracinaceae bacterium]|nr:AgmX/PglI C-terminal domain-containing protein [Sandaracinaceae bacterium]